MVQMAPLAGQELAHSQVPRWRAPVQRGFAGGSRATLIFEAAGEKTEEAGSALPLVREGAR